MKSDPREVTAEHIESYLAKTKAALDKLEDVAPEPSWHARMAADFLRMATSYHADAVDFAAKGDRVRAFACVNYAHGWLDAGARLGLWDVGRDGELFTLLE